MQTSTNHLLKFLPCGDGAESQIATEFDFVWFKALPALVRNNVKPVRFFFFDLLRIDRTVVVISLFQYVFAMAVCAMLMQGVEEHASSAHPGPDSPQAAQYVNLAATGMWSFSCLACVWAAFAHRSSVASVCVSAQVIYGIFFLANTLAGFLVAIVDLAGGSGSARVVSQACWLIFALPLGAYNTLLIMSLSTHLDHPVSM